MAKNFTQYRFPKPDNVPEPLRKSDEVSIAERQMASQDFTANKKGWGLFPDGSAQFQAFQVKNVIKTVPLGGDIQGAIETLNANGGGEVVLSAGTYNLSSNITLYDGVSLRGAGRDLTILEFSGGAFGIRSVGTTGDFVKNFKLSDFTLQNSNASGGIYVDYSSNFSIENVSVTSCDQEGIYILHSSDFLLTNINSGSNTKTGLRVESDSATETSDNFIVQNSTFSNNTDSGIYLYDVYVYDYTFVRCTASSNGVDGFETEESLGFGGNNGGLILGCIFSSNSRDGIRSYNDRSSFIGNVTLSNSNAGIRIVNSADIAVVGNTSKSNNLDSSDGNIRLTSCTSTAVVGNSVSVNVNQEPKFAIASNGNTENYIQNNIGSTATEEVASTAMLNTSGGSLSGGSVVIYKAVADGDEITTTTTQGDDLVAGVLEGVGGASTTNGNYGYVIQEGKITNLKANGEEDISVGDFLQTHTVAGISARASTAGQMVFGIALEAYSTGDDNGVIDALIFKPRKL